MRANNMTSKGKVTRAAMAVGLAISMALACAPGAALATTAEESMGEESAARVDAVQEAAPANEELATQADELETEPAISAQAHDTMADAMPISLNQTYRGVINGDNPTDYYKFSLPSTGEITISFSAPNRGWGMHEGWATPSGVVYDTKGNEVWSHGMVNQNVYNIKLVKGDYYLAFKMHEASVNDYSFHFAFTDDHETFTEEPGGSNNSLWKATPIELGKAYTSVIAENDGIDYFKFTLDRKREVILSCVARIGFLDLTLFDDNGKELYDWHDDHVVGADDRNISHECTLEKGTYYLRLEPWHSQTGVVEFRLKAVPKTFPDVDAGSWYAGVVASASELGFISGYDNGNFGPNDRVTRGQVAVILWNMAGRPGSGGAGRSFPDVDSGAYYYAAVKWAGSVGVVSGYENGSFGPNDLVTREQLAAMLTSYAGKVARRNTSGSASDYAQMRDAGKVSGWAAKSVGWCFRNKIISGTNDGRVNPKCNATRAETAKMVVYLHDLL